MQRELWAARDLDGELFLYDFEPWDEVGSWQIDSRDGSTLMLLPQSLLPSLKPGEKRRVKLVMCDD